MKPLLSVLLIIVFAAQCSTYVHREVKLTESETRLANQLRDVTKRYLDEQLTFYSRGGKAFSKFEVLGVDETDGIIHEYVWYYFSEYVFRGGHLITGSGQSLPVALNVKRDGNTFKVESHQAQLAGELFMFPEKLHDMLKGYVPPQDWELQTKEDAKKYYNLH